METKRTEKYPKAVGFIVTNEFCERFNYYGMRTILALYLRDKLAFSDDGATIVFHTFAMICYFFPLAGAMIADGWLGRFRTIFYLSFLYAIGSILIALGAMPPLNLPQLQITLVALLLIALGTGGIKPCVSAFGGDQFKLPEQARYLGTFFSVFYFAINAGSLISTFLTPILRADVHCFGEKDCFSLAFGVPGLLMVCSIIIFVAGKRLYIIKTPQGNIIVKVFACIFHAIFRRFKIKEKRAHWLDYADDKHDKSLIEDIKSTFRVLVLFIPVPVFWALFDQQGSRWTFQADRMNQEIGSWTLKADQMQVVNPLLILAFIPMFEMGVYPFLARIKLVRKPLHKMIAGGLLAALAFVISGIVELRLLPTYGTPLQAGFAQLRVYNGFDCEFTITVNSKDAIISPLGVYESLHIPLTGKIDLTYNLNGKDGECASMNNVAGTFPLEEKKANSFFINYVGVTAFADNNEKALDGAHIRFLMNTKGQVPVKVLNRKNETVLNMTSVDRDQHALERGMYDVYIDNKVALKGYNFKAGAVYSMTYNGVKLNPVIITPPNSIHILWLVPQYVVMTMGEVMFSVTGLEFSFTQAPKSMKSVLQSVWLLTVALGNLIVVLIVEGNFMDAQWKEFFLFAGLMCLDILIFMVMSWKYKYIDPSEQKSDDINLTEKK